MWNILHPSPCARWPTCPEDCCFWWTLTLHSKWLQQVSQAAVIWHQRYCSRQKCTEANALKIWRCEPKSLSGEKMHHRDGFVLSLLQICSSAWDCVENCCKRSYHTKRKECWKAEDAQPEKSFASSCGSSWKKEERDPGPEGETWEDFRGVCWEVFRWPPIAATARINDILTDQSKSTMRDEVQCRMVAQLCACENCKSKGIQAAKQP